LPGIPKIELEGANERFSIGSSGDQQPSRSLFFKPDGRLFFGRPPQIIHHRRIN